MARCSIRVPSFAAVVSVLMAVASAEPVPVFVDGRFGDWSAVLPTAQDSIGDGGASGIDFGRLWMANDGRDLFVRFTLGTEVVLQESNALTLYMDTDDDAGTGTAVAGMGADLVWSFGGRNGTYRGATIYWDDIGIIAGPSYGSEEFEISLRRDAAPSGQALFPSSTVRVALRDGASGGDWVPSSSANVAYTFDDSDPLEPSLIQLGKEDPSHLRVMTYNVLWDGLWDRPAPHTRMIQAIVPDMIAYQEIGSHTGSQTQTWVENALGGTWYVDWDGELQLISRYPILQGWATGEGRAHASLVDLPAPFDHDLLVINVHLKCCSNGDQQRQDQIDDVMSFVRDAMSPGGSVTLAPDTPIMIMGDTNMYGDSHQVLTLLTGDIADNGTYGPDFAPDWDGGDLDEVYARQPTVRHSYSWYSTSSSYQPSYIDRMAVTGSVLDIAKSYILHTQEIPAPVLAAAGLLATDSEDASDHAPHVVDLSPTPIVAVGDPSMVTPRLRLAVRPNPFRTQTAFRFELARAERVRVELFDAAGRIVTRLLDERLPAGPHTVTWEAAPELPSGTYFARVREGGRVEAAKVLRLR